MKPSSLEHYLQQRYRPATARAYARQIHNYLSNHSHAARYHYADIVAAIGLLRSRYPNPGTLVAILSAIKAYYHYLFVTGVRSDDPAVNIVLKDPIARDIQVQDLLTRQELQALLNRKERYGLLAVRNRVLMGLLIYQALLPKEIAALKLGDVDLRAGTVVVRAQGNTHQRTLSLQADQVLLLMDYISDTRVRLLNGKEHDFLVLGSRGRVLSADQITKHVHRSFKGWYGSRKVSPLKIRQSVLSHLLAEHRDLRWVQVFAGHKKPSSTEQYQQSSTEALKQQMLLYHPFR